MQKGREPSGDHFGILPAGILLETENQLLMHESYLD